MELRHLRYFVGVAEELHFARAAAHLGISQPPLSQQIRALEDELGVRLLDRTSRRVSLTPAGRLFLDEAREVLQRAERAVTVARRAARGEVGQLAIGFNASAPFVSQIAAGIAEYRRLYPEVRLVLREAAGPSQIEAIEDHLLDIGFVRGAQMPNLPPVVTAVALLRERLFVAMPPEHPLAARSGVHLRDLANEPLLVYSNERGRSFTDNLLNILRQAGVEPMIAQTVSEVSSLFGLAAAGVGLAVLAESICSLQSAKLTYRPLLDESALVTLWMVYHNGGATLPCQNFVEIMRPGELRT
jgi:DNA-binding transcriptional LysR family regulator